MNNLDDIGKLILRLSVGILLLMHGLFKLMHGIAGISALIHANGWPVWIAYGVYIGEIAIYLAHSHQLFQLTKTGGWLLELQGLYLFGALAIALLGAGRFSVGGTRGRMN
jgi:putative oxidoreductase